MKPFLIMLACLICFTVGFMCGVSTTQTVFRNYPTKQEGYRSTQTTSERYSANLRRLK